MLHYADEKEVYEISICVQILNFCSNLLSLEHIFAYTAYRADPIIGDLLERRSGGYSRIRISCFRIINVTANGAHILLHIHSPPFGLGLCQWPLVLKSLSF